MAGFLRMAALRVAVYAARWERLKEAARRGLRHRRTAPYVQRIGGRIFNGYPKVVEKSIGSIEKEGKNGLAHSKPGDNCLI